MNESNGMPTQSLTPQHDPFIGMRILDQYSVETKLGEGGMGAVYLAEQTGLGRKVAIKFLKPEVGQSADMVARFIREARSVSRLDHPNIVKVYNFGECGDSRLYLAMEYVAGIPLKKMIADSAPLDLETVCTIGVQLADALAFAHQEQVVHRDLKPENILLVNINGRWIPKILDFGIAKVLDPASAENDAGLTRDNRVYGTPNYMSPEQARGVAVDHRTDIYALGVMLYEMLAGQRPIQASSAMGMLIALAADAPKPLAEAVATPLPPPLVAIIMQMLAKDPAARPESMWQVRQVLEQQLTDMRLAAHPDKHKFLFKRKTWITVGSIAVLSTALGTTFIVNKIDAERSKGLIAAAQQAAAGSTRVIKREVVETSGATEPEWAQSNEQVSEQDNTWIIRSTASDQPDLDTAETAMRNNAAATVLLLMANGVHLPNFAQAVYLPIISARNGLTEKFAAAVSSQDTDTANSMREEFRVREAQIWQMFQQRFTNILQPKELYWRKIRLTMQNDTQRDVYETFRLFAVKPSAVNIPYYTEATTSKEIGITVTHFFPALIWAHEVYNGVVILEVLPNSPAHRADLRIGDVISAVEGKEGLGLTSFNRIMPQLVQPLAQKQPVKLLVSRNGHTMPITLKP